jgi:protein transport protein SEC24
MPRVGPGALHAEPKEADMYETSKESSLYVPRDNTWRDIGTECVEDGIGVSMFLTMSKYIDVGSIGAIHTCIYMR